MKSENISKQFLAESDLVFAIATSFLARVG